MLRSIFLLYILVISADIYAEPFKLEVISLVPGQSTKSDVERVKSGVGYIIGGYELLCVPEYLGEVLSQLLCLTGESYYSRDTTSESYRQK